ncbi:MAG: SxtJ family membrane protein [Bacteroidota bacterium]
MTDTPAPGREVRRFGLVFGGVLVLGAAYLLWRGSAGWGWLLAAAGLFGAAALAAFSVLRPLYWVWMRLAAVLAWVNTRVLLGLFFYLLLTPLGVLFRLAGRDPLGRRPAAGAASYWIPRTRSAPDIKRSEHLF